MAVRITCINKDNGNHQNPHEAITHLGWVNEATGESGKSTRLEMYDFLQNKGGQAYTKDNFGNVAYLYPRVSPNNNPFVQTVADRTYTDNLLSLMECR